MITPGGAISTVGRNGARGFSGDGGPATAAQMWPSDIAVDAAGNLYIADSMNNRIRKVTTDGVVNTVAGSGGTGTGSVSPEPSPGVIGDGGPATAARLNIPTGVAVDMAGNLLISDLGNNRVRIVVPNGTIRTAAGNGTGGFTGDDGPATLAQMSNPNGVAVDSAGNVYIADSLNARVRKVTPDGVIRTIAGMGIIPGFGSSHLVVPDGYLLGPQAVAVDEQGNVFIADGSVVRKVTPDGTTRIVAGNLSGFSGDGEGGLATATPIAALGIADGVGNLFIADHLKNRVRKVTPAE
jgi:sugar lactone lactonase YvrE